MRDKSVKLMNAAPDLLKACLTLIQQAEVCRYQTADGQHHLLNNLAISEIRRAIEKATVPGDENLYDYIQAIGRVQRKSLS